MLEFKETNQGILMKFKKYAVLGVLMAAISYLFISQNKKAGLYEASSVAEEKYCMAFRGNGELEPAHWGAAARVIEQWGMPLAMAGGSSGSISMFVLNGLAQNPFLNEPQLDPAEKKLRASLMVKSFLGFFIELKKTRFSQDFFKLYGEFNKFKALSITEQMKLELLKNNYTQAIGLINQGVELGLLDLVSMQPLLDALKGKQSVRSQFYLQQLHESIELFGKFDANKDANLFFRPGLISFENASYSFGRWAGFYAVPTEDSQILSAWRNFLKECSAISLKKSWVGILKEKPQCGSLFHTIFEAYFRNEPRVHLEDQEVGSPIPAYPTTSVLVGRAAEQVKQGFIDYDRSLSPQFGQSFKIENSEEVRFGYWGDPAMLGRIESALDKSDEKSRRFLALGKTSWKTVLSLSPAEPGLSPLIPFKLGEKEVVSAGGWSDLHPINVLKASGCERVIFLTRQGGESPFGQGIANRLLNLQKDGTKFGDKTYNDFGDASANPKETWSLLFNLANPKSSINLALAQATAVACTNWNAFDVKKDLMELIEDAYRSPYWISPNAVGEVSLSPVLQEKRPGCQPLKLD